MADNNPKYLSAPINGAKRFEHPPIMTTLPHEEGQSSKGLENSAHIPSVNNELWEMNKPLEGDFALDSEKDPYIFLGSSHHFSDPALDLEYQDKLSILPCTREQEEGQPFERIEVTKDQALDMFSDNKFKASSSSWIGNRDSESFYGISCTDDNLPKVYLKSTEDARQCDHILLGLQQQLVFCHPLSPGSWFFLPLGTRVYNKLLAFIKKEYWRRGYTEVISPNMYNMKLWETSGHAANAKENMYTFDVDKQEFGLKSMNCPGHCLIFLHRVRSYRELPMRLADFGVLHRKEASEALSGLTRVRRFQQDDAHIFCTKDQVREEVKSVLDFVDCVYTKFGFTYELKLSTRPEKYFGDLETWVRAEEDLEKALKEFGKPFLLNIGDGEFYGPKIDITVSDAVKKNIQCATLQLDFQLPDCFKLEYSSSAEDEVKREKPVMIHRAVLGSVEQIFAILLEHYQGKWPFWLSPRQAIVCSSSKKHHSYAEKVRDQIHEAGYYVDVDISDREIGEKVREAQVAQYNFILVVGDEEATAGQVTVQLREQDGSDFAVMSIETLLDVFNLESANFL